jgi:membrane protease YdiL (CAAX protease family)
VVFSSFLSRTLAFQTLGYLLGALVIGFFVIVQRKGDWSSLGLRRDQDSVAQVLRGAGFGVVLIACYTPVGFMLAGGHFSIEGLVAVLVGNTTSAGLVLAAVVTLVGAPVMEEIYYRGMLYEKLNRRSALLAIVLTSVLFVAAHGALIIPSLLLLAFGLAIKRQTKTLWYTMGAHAAWNTVVLVIAAAMLVGGMHSFTSRSGRVSLSYAHDWTSHPDMQESLPTGSIDLVLGAADGSRIEVFEVPTDPGAGPKAMKRVLASTGGLALSSDPGRARVRSVARSRVVFDRGSPAYELHATFTSPSGLSLRERVVAVQPLGSGYSVLFDFSCAKQMCSHDAPDFSDMLSSVHLN